MRSHDPYVRSMLHKLIALGCFLAAAGFAVPADAAVTQAFAFSAVRSTTPPPLDAALADPIWQTAVAATGFEDFTAHVPARSATTAYLLYDDTNLYVGFKCEQHGIPITATQTVNDVGSGIDDTVLVSIDTSGSGARTYTFSATPRGVRSESSSESARYNPPWQATALQTPDGYSVMLVIPLKDMRLQAGATQSWRINVARRIAATNTLLTWAYDANSNSYCAGSSSAIQYCDSTRWPTMKDIRVKSGAKPQPYADIYGLGSVGSDRDVFEATPGSFVQRQPRALGIDATVPVTPTLAFVGTLAPDFSNVEADQTTIAPQEFGIRYQEYRPFFAQGAQYINAISAFNVNKYNYQAFYSPSIGIFDTGYKLEGTIGRSAIGALDVRGPGIDDQVVGYSNARPDGSLSFSGGEVLAHHDGVVDETIGIGGSYTNLKSGFDPIVGISTDRGTNVPDPAQGDNVEIGFLQQHGTLLVGAVYRDIGPEYDPLDGYTPINDIRGPQAFIQQNGVGRKGSIVKSYELAVVADRFLDRSGAVHAADTALVAQVTLTDLLSLTVQGGASELRSYATAYPAYVAPSISPFDQTTFSLGYKDGSPSPIDLTYAFGPFGVTCYGVEPQPLLCGANAGTFPAFVQQLDASTTRTLTHGYGVSFEYGGTIEHGEGLTSDSEWLRRVSLTKAFGAEGQFSVGFRSINGTGGFATPGGNLAISYHQRFRNQSNLYFEYGTPAATRTLHRVILKYVFHVGGGAGT